LSQRLYQEGFRVTAVDAFAEVFRLHGTIPFHELDVEKDWAGLEGRFDAICAVEIIEHLENPYLFVRRCFDALQHGGLIVLSTPNAGHYVSRIRFLLASVFELYSPPSFSPKATTDGGTLLPPHIHAFTGWMIKGNLERAGFRDVSFTASSTWLTGLSPIPRRPLNFLRWGLNHLVGGLAVPIMRSPAGDSIFSRNIVVMARKP
jgi:SAM-dependent methyltransferase